jgi:hypothetical protein
MDIEELRLVYEAGMKGFPPRKPEQPIFYPVLNLEYANEIAKRWNAESHPRPATWPNLILMTRMALDLNLRKLAVRTMSSFEFRQRSCLASTNTSFHPL